MTTTRSSGFPAFLKASQITLLRIIKGEIFRPMILRSQLGMLHPNLSLSPVTADYGPGRMDERSPEMRLIRRLEGLD